MKIRSRATGALVAALVLGGVIPTSAMAEAVTYRNQDVRSVTSAGGVEWASLDIPTGYDRERLNRHAVGWYEKTPGSRYILLDLQPRIDTLSEMRAERRQFAEDMGSSYTEFAFHVNEVGAKVRARWVFTYTEGSGEKLPYISVLLIRGGNRLTMGGRLAEAEHVREIRRHVVRSLAFPS